MELFNEAVGKIKGMETCESDLYVRVEGKGERVILIHGGNTEDTAITWSEQRGLAHHYELVVPDRRGYGHSPRRDGPWTYECDVEDLIPLLGKGAHLVGSSAGGLIALLLAGKQPKLVRSLTVIEPPAFGIASDHPEVAKIIEALKPVFWSTSAPETFLLGFMKALGQYIPEPVRLLLQQRKGVEAMMQEPEPWTISLPLETLADLACPKLVVSGDWHPAFLITADKLAQSIQAERLTIKGAGHVTQNMGKPFNDRLQALISSA